MTPSGISFVYVSALLVSISCNGPQKSFGVKVISFIIINWDGPGNTGLYESDHTRLHRLLTCHFSTPVIENEDSYPKSCWWRTLLLTQSKDEISMSSRSFKHKRCSNRCCMFQNLMQTQSYRLAAFSVSETHHNMFLLSRTQEKFFGHDISWKPKIFYRHLMKRSKLQHHKLRLNYTTKHDIAIFCACEETLLKCYPPIFDCGEQATGQDDSKIAMA